MTRGLVITITAADRPGIVEDVTAVLLDHGANLAESRMARLGGEFAGILLATCDTARAAALGAALEGLSARGLAVSVRGTDPAGPDRAAGRAASRSAGAVPYEIRVTGADHEGIVHGIAEKLAARGINIEDLATGVVPAPVTGTPLFTMRALVAVPADVRTRALREEMDRLADDLGVEIEVRPATA
jgi:glycine cleavage system regulatory protein